METIYTVGDYSVLYCDVRLEYYIKGKDGYVFFPKIEYVDQHIARFLYKDMAIKECNRLAETA